MSVGLEEAIPRRRPGLATALGARLRQISRRLHYRALLLSAGSFLVVGLAVSGAYRATHGLPYISVMTEKLDLLDSAAADAYGIVFLGSSETFHHVDPAVVEQELAKCGVQERVLNLGVPALRGPELRYLVRRLVERRPKRLRLVVMQDAIPAEGVLANALSDRGRYFRGWDEIGEAAEDVACYTGSKLGQAKRALIAGDAIATEQLGTARLSQALLPAPRRAPDHYASGKYERFDGYWPITSDDYDPARHSDDNWFVAARAAFAKERAGFADAVRDGGATPDPSSAQCRARYLDDTLQSFRAAGYRAAYYVSPGPYWINHDRAVATALHREDPDLPILDYNEPAAYPALFDDALWFDRTHLLATGAERLSRDIGRDLCGLLAK